MNLFLSSLITLGCAHQRSLGDYEKRINKGHYAWVSQQTLRANAAYSREEAALSLLEVPLTIDTKSRSEIKENLDECITNPKELATVRSACARAAGHLKLYESADGITDAMDTVDDESRYWMLVALIELAVASPAAVAKIESLKNDRDIFIAQRAKQWMTAQ